MWCFTFSCWYCIFAIWYVCALLADLTSTSRILRAIKLVCALRHRGSGGAVLPFSSPARPLVSFLFLIMHPYQKYTLGGFWCFLSRSHLGDPTVTLLVQEIRSCFVSFFLSYSKLRISHPVSICDCFETCQCLFLWFILFFSYILEIY